MKTKLLILLSFLFLLACKKEEEKPQKEKVKLYVFASTGIYINNGNPALLTLSGTNIDTVKNFSGSYILDVDYPKGENQTLTLTSSRKDIDVQIIVSRDLSQFNPDELVNKFDTGSLTVSFIAK